MSVGYRYLINELGLRVSHVGVEARANRRVNSLVKLDGAIQVPFGLMPQDNDLVGHLFFALKNQGVELEALEAVLTHIDPGLMQSAVNANPNGKYVRQAAFLFERFTGQSLQTATSITSYVDLFDPRRYLTGAPRRDRKFKVNQNGLGDLAYCPTVRLTKPLADLLQRDLFADLAAFVEGAGGAKNLDRALGWAYLSETRSSFNIEGESPSEDKSRRFVRILRQAHQAIPLSEDYLSSLQIEVINNPYLQDMHFRLKQNWLQKASGHRYASDVTFIPPAPESLPGLMDGLMDYANAAYPSNSKEALVKSLLVSFGFVFNHPFMDGNGRLSRFLIHHGLCRAGLLEEGLILPVSVAFQHHEDQYLDALESVSKPIRQLWDVSYLGDNEIHAMLNASANPYKYWDGTKIAEFGVRMAHYALDSSLAEEMDYLRRFDACAAVINKQFDIQGKDLANLIMMAANNHGTLSARRRKQYAPRVPAEILDAIEDVVGNVFSFEDDPSPNSIPKA